MHPRFAALSVTLAIALVPTPPATAQDQDAVERAEQRVVAKWEIQVKAAQDHLNLIEKARLRIADFETQKAPVPAEVNAAIASIKQAYPDYRLTYRVPADLDIIYRALIEARGDAGDRWMAGVGRQQQAVELVTTYSMIKTESEVAQAKGEAFGMSQIEKVFLKRLAEMESGPVETAFHCTSYLTAPDLTNSCH